MPDVNPYASPKTPALGFGEQKYIASNVRNRCPVCDALVDPWKVGNSIRRHRCSNCNAQVWMGISNRTSLICISLPLALIAVWYLVLPHNTIVLGCGLIGIGFPIINIYVRILFGHTVAMRPEATDEVGSALD